MGNREVIQLDDHHYIIKKYQEFDRRYIYDFNGNLSHVDFIIYPAKIKSAADLEYLRQHGNNIYPYYVYRHDNRGNLFGVWYISRGKEYFFGSDRSILYKCELLICHDMQGNQLPYTQYYY